MQKALIALLVLVSTQSLAHEIAKSNRSSRKSTSAYVPPEYKKLLNACYQDACSDVKSSDLTTAEALAFEKKYGELFSSVYKGNAEFTKLFKSVLRQKIDSYSRQLRLDQDKINEAMKTSGASDSKVKKVQRGLANVQTIGKYLAQNTLTEDSKFLCLSKIAQKAHDYPTKKELENFDTFLQSTVKEYFKSLKKELPDESNSAEKLADRFKGMELNFSMINQERYIELVEERFKELSARDYSSSADSGVSRFMSRYMDEPLSSSNLTSELVSVLTHSYCGQFAGGLSDDLGDSVKMNTYGVKLKSVGNIKLKNPVPQLLNVSFETIKERDRGTLYHELSHYTYYMIGHNKYASKSSRNKFKSPTSCLKRMHPKASRISFSGKKLKSDFYVSEDIADYYATKMLKGTLHSASLRDNFCKWIKEGKREIAIYSVDENDPDDHSADLLRVLHMNKILGKNVPKSCEFEFTQFGGSDKVIRDCSKSNE